MYKSYMIKRTVTFQGIVILIMLALTQGCRISTEDKINLKRTEVKQLSEVLDSISFMNNELVDYAVCTEFDFFACQNFKYFNYLENDKMALHNERFAGQTSESLSGLGTNHESSNIFSVTGIIQGFVCVTLREDEYSFSCKSETNRYKFYLVKIWEDGFEIIESNEVHFG